MGALNFAVKLLCIAEMNRVTRLPIEIDSLTVDLNGSAIITGIRVMPQPVAEDSRWELAHIISIDFIRVHFPFFPAFLLFILSWGELVITDDISIHGLRFYVEGYREPDGKLSLNVNLIGKRKTENPLPDGIEQLATLCGLESVLLDENYFSIIAIKSENRNSSPDQKTERVIKTESKPSKHAESASVEHERPTSLSSWAHKMFSFAETEIEHHGGLINAAIHRAKRVVDRKVHEKIASLHVHLAGEEPMKTPRGMRIIARHVHFDYIEINLVRALPISLRRLERRPLIVDKLDFACLGFEHVPLVLLRPVTQTNSNSRANSVSQENPHFSQEIPSCPLHIEVKTETENNPPAVQHPQPQLQPQQPQQPRQIDYFSLPVNTAGLDARIFKYWFERKLLFALYKANASRLAVDALHLSTWTSNSLGEEFSPFEHFLNHETEEEEEERGSYQEGAAAVDFVLDEYEKEIESRLREKEKKKSSSVNNNGSSSSSSHHSSQRRKIISMHPIFDI